MRPVQPSVVADRHHVMLSAVPASGRVNTMIRITGIGDHDRLEWLIRINGIRIESIDTSTLVGLRDRALIGVMTYAFARIGAVVSMRIEDYFANGKRWWVRLHEKGGKRHEMPAHHKLEHFLDEYIKAAGIGDGGKSPLFRSAARRTGTLTARAMTRIDAWRMIQRRAAELGSKVKIGCHTFRATGITAYLEAGSTLENAQAMAAHEPAYTRLSNSLLTSSHLPLSPAVRGTAGRGGVVIHTHVLRLESAVTAKQTARRAAYPQPTPATLRGCF
jgi:integrase